MYDVVFIGKPLDVGELNTVTVDPDALRECKGEAGNFSLRTKKDPITSKTIVINLEQYQLVPLEGGISFGDYSQEPADNVIFIQDWQVTSPGICTQMGLEQALQFTKEKPESNIYYFYRSLRFINDNDRLFEEARLQGVNFLKYDKDDLKTKNNGAGLSVEYRREGIDLSLQGTVFVAPLLQPSPMLKKLAALFNLQQDEAGYLQPQNVYLQPTLTTRRGVYALGGARGPQAFSRQKEEAFYTLQEINLLCGGIRPLVDDRREVDDDKCILCYTCYRICPHGAIEREPDKDAMRIMELACQGCNGCISHCPAGAITLVKNKEEPQKSTASVLLCKNSGQIAMERMGKKKLESLVTEMIPCSCSIKKEDIFRYLRGGKDRLLVIGCFEESCKHIRGEKRADRVITEARHILDELGMEPKKVAFERLSPRMEDDLEYIIQRWKEDKL